MKPANNIIFMQLSVKKNVAEEWRHLAAVLCISSASFSNHLKRNAEKPPSDERQSFDYFQKKKSANDRRTRGEIEHETNAMLSRERPEPAV